jgi:hypothetical protein
MASDAIGRSPIEEERSKQLGDEVKLDGLHRDVEVGPEMIDIDRIEQVYRYCSPQTISASGNDTNCLIASSTDAYYLV